MPNASCSTTFTCETSNGVYPPLEKGEVMGIHLNKMLSNSVTFKMTGSYVGPDLRAGRYEMDVDGPFGERALLKRG